MPWREHHVGEHIGLGVVHEGRKLGQLGPELVGDLAPLRVAASASSWANAVAMKTTRYSDSNSLARIAGIEWIILLAIPERMDDAHTSPSSPHDQHQRNACLRF